MSLRDEILALIKGQPGIHSAEFYGQIENTTRADIQTWLKQLRREGLIEQYDRGHWRIAELNPQPMEIGPTELAPPRGSSSSFIRPVPLRRLMAGR